MDIIATITTSTNSDRIEGDDLWRVGVFGSQSETGSGSRRNEVWNILTDDVASTTLIPGRDLVLNGNADLNLQGIGTGQDYPYFCMEFAKGDSPNPDFDLPMQHGAIIVCLSLAGTPVDSGRASVMFRRFSSGYEMGRKYQDGTTDLTVEATVTPDSRSDPLSGRGLWKLGVFGSSNEDGTGRRYTVSPQVLRPPHSDQTLHPDRDLEFVVTDNVDLRAVGPGTNYPYLCLEFDKGPRASPDYDLSLGSADTIISCHELYGTGVTDGGHGGTNGGGSHGSNDRPRALVSGVSYEIGKSPVPDSHLTNVTVTVSITPFDTSSTITGRNLWRLGIFGSRESNGEGQRMGEVSQLLSPRERAKTLQSDSTLTLHGTAVADLRGIGGTDFPYLCVEFGKADPNSDFDFPVHNPSGTFLSCTLYQPPGGSGGGGGGGNGGHGDDPDKPNALFSNFRASISPTVIQDSHLVRVAIEGTVTTDDLTEYIPSAELRLGLFGSGSQTGLGARVNEVRQLLPRDFTHPVYSRRPVDLEVTSDLDLRGIGADTDYPYICVEFDRKNDYVDFDMPRGPMVACSPYTAPTGGRTLEPDSDRPRAIVGSMRNSLRFMQVPGTNLLEATVGLEVTSQVSADYIPEDVNWRVGIFGSAMDDGSGRRKKEVSQLLPRDQQRYSWAPGETLNFEVTEQLDLNGIGTGTNNPYLCIEFDTANDHVTFDLPHGAMVSCQEFDNPGPYISPEPEPDPEETPRVTVTSVTPEKNVKRKEKGTADVTFDVAVAVDRSSDPVHGNNLWVLTIFSSKKKNGKGPRLGEVEQVLSRSQQSQAIQNGKKIPFRDVSMTLDLTGVKCKDAKYLCAEISQGSNRDYELESSVIGCQKMKCAKKSKKGKPPAAAGSTLTVSSVMPSRVSVFDDRIYSIRFNAPIEFDPSQSEALTRGVSLWKMSVWFNKDASDSKQHALVEQVLTGNKKSKYVSDPSRPFGFGQFELEVDLRGLTCKKLKYFCVKLTTDDPTPPFTLAEASPDSSIGCTRTTCR